MGNTNTQKFLLIALIVALILGIIAFSIANYQKLNAFIVGFFITFICLMLYFCWYRCSKCGNLLAVKVINTELLDTKQCKSYFTREESVGASVRRNRYGEVVGETIHYEDVNYVTTTTTKTYEKTSVCKYCGAMSKYQFDQKSDETHRCQ